MNIIFFGSSEFSVLSLKAILAAGHKVSCVVTQPDRPKGRGLHLEGTAVKALAKKAGLKIYQPQTINTPAAEGFLKELNPDLFVVIAYGQILSGEILSVPKIISINAHASLLPEYRGAAPINWAIIKSHNERRITGISIIKMAKKMDSGPIISQKEIWIEKEDDAITLEEKLSGAAAQLLPAVLESIQNNSYELKQQQGPVSYAPKLKKENGLIRWSEAPAIVNSLIRGCLPWPVAYTYYQGKIIKVYKAFIFSEFEEPPQHAEPGIIKEINADAISVVCGRGVLNIRELQLEGARRMSAAEFVRGHKIRPGEILGKI